MLYHYLLTYTISSMVINLPFRKLYWVLASSVVWSHFFDLYYHYNCSSMCFCSTNTAVISFSPIWHTVQCYNILGCKKVEFTCFDIWTATYTFNTYKYITLTYLKGTLNQIGSIVLRNLHRFFRIYHIKIHLWFYSSI